MRSSGLTSTAPRAKLGTGCMRDIDSEIAGGLNHILQSDIQSKVYSRGIDGSRKSFCQRHMSILGAAKVFRPPVFNRYRTGVDHVVGRIALPERRQINEHFEGGAWMAIGFSGTVELAGAIVAAADHSNHSPVRAHRHQCSL